MVGSPVVFCRFIISDFTAMQEYNAAAAPTSGRYDIHRHTQVE
jgi:hypothetical protein